MSDTTPITRATAVFEPEPEPVLVCSNCRTTISDDDAECPSCDAPLDWGASFMAVRDWQAAGGGA